MINPLNYERVAIGSPNIQEIQQIHYIGNFKGVESYVGKILPPNGVIYDIVTPIILITGVGNDCGKFATQLSLKRQLDERGLVNKCITYNPLGLIFQMDYLKYPTNQSFRDIIFSINGFVRQTESKMKYECLIINVGGGMFPLSKRNINDFGMLYQAYLNALPIDYLILCTNSGIETTVIKKEINKLRSSQNLDIAIVVSNMNYDDYSIENTTNTSPYVEDKKIVDLGIQKYREDFPDCPIFSFDEIDKGDLLNDIIDKMT